jgi:hypothetical protein
MIPLPHCDVYIGRQEGTLVTGHEKRELRTRLPTQNMRTYLLRKHGWSPSAYERVNWSMYGRASGSVSPQEHTFVTKFCTDWLPVGRRVLKYGNEHGHCPYCREYEDYDHMFNCRTRHEWRDTFSNDLENQLKTWQTAADIRTAIVTGLHEWMSAKPSTIRASDDDTLTWHHFIRGYVDTAWSQEQEHFYRRQELDPTKGFTGDGWTANLIGYMWRQSRAVWKLRCEELHDDTPIENAREIQELSARVHALYRVSPELNNHDRRIFDQPIEQTLGQSTRNLRLWVRRIGPIVKLGLRDAHLQAIRGVQDIRNFFEPRRQPP